MVYVNGILPWAVIRPNIIAFAECVEPDAPCGKIALAPIGITSGSLGWSEQGAGVSFRDQCANAVLDVALVE